MQDDSLQDGVHGMVPDAAMSASARKLRATYALTPGAPLYRRAMGYYCLERWAEQGMPQGVPLEQLFDFDEPGFITLGHAGGCEAAFEPAFEVKVLEQRGEHEIVQDHAGRHVLYFKGRRDGFMPEYLEHPVKDMRTWQALKWRLDPRSLARYVDLEKRMAQARAEAARGMMVSQELIGGYMYLRSLIGPSELLYAFYDMPALIHDCMETWLELTDGVIAHHQQYVTLDELYFDEDITYNAGPLISPEMIRTFLVPYYQQLVSNVKRRQLDPARHLYVQIDTDGHAPSVIPVFRDTIGMDVMCPFEVASGCDVVQIGREHPDLVIVGGIDKRILAAGREAIDRELERILPVMRARGGYIPTCDHGVPEEVPYQDYLYYRRRCVELGG